MRFKNKKAAMEMSMGTIVTIVLVVVTLVLALVLIRSIFSGGTNAVSQINDAIQGQINQLFSSGEAIALYPEDGSVTIKRGSTPSGFAFAVQNPDNTPATFTYNVSTTQLGLHNCGALTVQEANNWVLSGSTLNAGSGAASSTQLVKFEVPKSAPACTIIYSLSVSENGGSGFADSKSIFLTLK